MFLITTADHHFWKKDGKILFLGEWCKIYNQRNIWSNLDYKVLPYHWDDREKLYHDYIYLDDVYERYLELLTTKLNDLHHVNYSNRYWRIVIGPWLYYFVEILYDRYLSIKEAIESGLVTDTWICAKNIEKWAPNDFEVFQEWFLSDEYNQYLYSRIIESLGELPFSFPDIENISPSGMTRNDDLEQRIKHIGRKLLEIYGKHLPSRWNQVVFVTSYLSTLDLIKLQLSLKQMPYPVSPTILPENVPVKLSMRKKLIINEGLNEYESILDWIIAEQIPKAYIEGYSSLHQMSLDAYPAKPKAIFTANAYHSDIGFKMWAAYQVEKGVRLIGTQHGGHYGTGLWSSSESHQINICDKYYTWGWRKTGDSKTIAFPTGKFAKIQRTIVPNPNGQILWASMSIPRYSYWMYSVPVGPQMLEYLDDQYRFAQSLLSEVHEQLLLRLYPQDYGWNEANRWMDQCSALNRYQGRESLNQQLNESRLFVGTYNATTYLETFSANFPTILFWNPKYWELRSSAKPYFDKLRKVGILHDTPESAARKVNEIYNDPQSWWDQLEVQEAKDEFCHQFACTSDDWLNEWKNELMDVIER